MLTDNQRADDLVQDTFLRAWRSLPSFALLTFAGGIITLVGGLSDLSVLSHSSVVFAYSVTLARTVVALTLGLGIGVMAASVLLTRPLQKHSH